MDVYKNFKTVVDTKIEELSCSFKELVHTPTGARILHIGNQDPENLFCLSFRTLPPSSNGVAHILEHTVLCGSKKFPIKDPFFAMTRRSLNTFMNAFTGSDFTCYPAASQIENDFYNLLNVYIDAVFHPILDKNSFYQEGCRLEFQEPENPHSPLLFKGIVYNEMKGSLSSADSRLWHAVLEELFPHLPYQYNSGGDPKDIPNLSYEELIDFHKMYYHPSRCLFFFYGNLPLEKHLDYLEEHVFSKSTPLPPLPLLPRQPRFTAPKNKTIHYPVSKEEDMNRKVIIAFGWLTSPLVEQEEVLALSLLDSILTDTDASPLKSAVLESGLCTQVGGFIDTEMSEVPYLFTCKGCREGDVDKIEEILFQKLRSLSQEPLPMQWIEASLHQLELSRMEISGDHSPFGLTLFFRSALTKQHGCDPLNTLQLQKLFSILLDKVKDPLYLPGLIRKHFVHNPHRVRLVMLPDPDLASKEVEEETESLQLLQSSLTAKQTEEILTITREQEKLQDSTEEQDLSCLPKVSLSDVPTSARDFVLTKTETPSLTVFHQDSFTNHILYTTLSFDLPHLEEEEIPYLHLLLYLIPELGSGKRDYKQNLEYIHSYTGGISLGVSLYGQTKDSSQHKPALSIKGKSLERNVDKLFPLLEETLIAPHLHDHKRIKDLIEQAHTSLQNRLSKNALSYASQLAQSNFSLSNHFNYLYTGLHYYHFIADIANNLSTKLPEVIEKLTLLHAKLFTFHNTECILSCDTSLFAKLEKKELPSLTLPARPFIPWAPSFSRKTTPSQARVIPAQVAYNVRAYPVASYIDPHSPALNIIPYLLENKVLHNKIREIGGAYGAGASYTSSTGSFYLYSYRDPHIKNTFSAFDAALTAIQKGQFSDQDLEEAKLGLIQHMDAPLTPCSKAIVAHSWLRTGKTLQIRQEHRDHVLKLGKKEISQVLEKEFLAPEKEHIDVSFSSKELLEKESSLPIHPL